MMKRWIAGSLAPLGELHVDAGAARALSEADAFSTDVHPPDLPPGELAGRVIGAVALLCLSALFSGLTLGLLGLGLFLWTLKTRQYDDLDGAASRILFDDTPRKESK